MALRRGRRWSKCVAWNGDNGPAARSTRSSTWLAAIAVMSAGVVPATAQDAAPEAAKSQQLPPVVVETAPTPPAKKKTTKKKTTPSSTSAAAQGTPPVQPPQSASDKPIPASNSGGVTGYLATRSSTATKTDSPLKDVPQSVTVVPKALAKDQGSRDMRQALSYVPGIVLGQGEGHRDAPTIRGVSTTADFFIDGVRDDVQYFRDLYNVERVEVLKGPNAMIFGRGGGGGVINRVTKQAEGERIYEATTTYGSFDTKRVEVDAGQALTKDFAFRILGMYEDSGSYRDFVDLERYGINPKVAFRPDEDTIVRLSYEYFHDDRTVDRGIPSDYLTGKPAKTDSSTFFGNPEDSYMTFESHLATATIERKLDNGVKLRNHTQYGKYEKFYQNVFANTALHQPPSTTVPADGLIRLGAYNNLTERESVFNQTDLTAKVDVGGGIRHTIVAGTELGYQETDNQRHRNSGNFDFAGKDVPFDDPTTSAGPSNWSADPGPLNHTAVTLAGVYVQDQIEITRYFQLIGGMRFDYFDVDYTNKTSGLQLDRVDNVWSPRAGAVFKPTEEVSLYVSYSKSFLPSTGDQFANLAGGVTGTANLQPEEFLNRELGFKWDIAPRLAFTGALFMLDRENQLVAIDGSTSTQIGKTRTKGGELALTGYLTHDWEVVAGYGYQFAEVIEGGKTGASTTGKEVALVPHHTFSLWNKYHFLPSWAAGLGVVSRSGMYANVDNAVRLPGFTRLDAALFWDVNEHLKAQLNVENVLDTEYYSTANSNNNITPGSPQAYYLTLTTKY